MGVGAVEYKVSEVRGLSTIRCLIVKPRPIMLSFLSIMLLSNAQNFAYYAQYYAHNYSNYATVYSFSD